ncbi:bacterio-opsin activator domain-containing protein [Natrononativus amylolyticus]|uniref:bacterio-opsin activator domain-containing protein n=1 Tax=Natrononativus amylolyticus TaxID=2963434 RepID=UPI0020CFB5D5|nr:bacterio-opsin activator domain-containing protein [Natrononativus amylolyticus]
MLFVSDGCLGLTGYDPISLEANEVNYEADIVHPDDTETVADAVEESVRTGDSFTLEYRIRTNEGKIRWVWERGYPVPGDDEPAARIEGLVLDITARKRLERALREEIVFTRRLLDVQRDIVYTIGHNGRMLRWNDRLVDVTGYDDPEIAEMSLQDFFPGAGDGAGTTVVHEITGRGAGVTTELTLVTASGDRIPYEISGDPVVDAAGETIGATGVCRDISERKRRERALERQRDELSRLNRINALIDEIIEALVTASTRETIETTICDRFTQSRFYRGAWVAERRSEAGVAAASGTESERCEEGVRSEIGRAFRENVVSVVRPAAGETAPAGSDRPTVLVPLSYGDTVYGVLVVEGARSDSPGEAERHAFEVLGEVVGFAINATTNRKLLLSDVATELTISLTGTNAVFVSLSERLECSLTLEGIVPIDGQRLLCYLSVEGTTPEAIREAVATDPTVSEPRVISRCPEQSFLEFTVSAGSEALRLVEYGATVQSMYCEQGAGEVVVRLPPDGDVREAVTIFREAFPGAALVARRTVTLPAQPVVDTRRAVTESLTERQRSILQAAYFAGYYDSPRKTTAQELADSLGIASSTLHQHLQAAHSKVLGIVLTEGTPSSQIADTEIPR